MIATAQELQNDDVINFGSSKEKRLGKVTLVASLNPQMKIIEGKCVKGGDFLEIREVNAQPICVFDAAYIQDYLAQ